MKGWHGKILRVDLTSSKVWDEPLGESLARTYLGGRGLGARIVHDELEPGLDPLSPGNRLVFAVGPLVGTKVPAAGRCSASTKAPLTGCIHDSNAGGRFGHRLKRTGYDAVVIQGKASSPVYLRVTNKGASLEDGTFLWGKDAKATSEILSAREGKGVSSACVGPAGENLVKISSIVVDGHRQFGRGGIGAVMGSKNMKALVCDGDCTTAVANEEAANFVVYESNKLLKANPITSQALPEFGTSVLVNLMNELGTLPTRNFQESRFEHAYNISGDAMAETILVKNTACHGCPIACTRRVKTGKIEGEGPEYETVWSLGAACGVGDLERVTEANWLANALGLDTISAGATIACAMELSEKGILEEPLHFGDGDVLLDLLRKIAYREGIGDDLAEGSLGFARKHGAPELAMQSKGLELPAYDPRGMQGQGLGYATSNRGGCHLRGNMLGLELLGVPKMVDRFATSGKAGLLIVHQNTGAAVDSLIMCKFTGFALGDEFFARLLSAVTGVDYRSQDIQEVGERIWNLERLFNNREGFGKADDTLPARLLEEGPPDGPTAGRVVDLEPMLQEYYRFRGWDSEGVPGRRKLEALGLVTGDGTGQALAGIKRGAAGA
ncbi:MAG: aldehyde ferredoxin oxidoreductase family protein [Firmicutes bacterium]|nr:aldehyde ferredoxin oxidoreductase family protein [Bacillota bacterium]